MENDKLSKLDAKIEELKIKHPKNQPNKGRSNVSALNVATDLLAGMGIGVTIGYYIDQYFNITPLFLIVCSCLGILAAFRLIWKEMNR